MSLDTVNKSIKYLETHNGRDKIVRTIQYGSRFLSWYLSQHNAADSAKKLKVLEDSSSMSRKVFRLAKSLQHFQSAGKTFLAESDGVIKITTVVQQLALALWLLYDHVIWAGKLGLVKTDKMPTYARRANIFWLVAMLMGIVKSLYQLQQSQGKLLRASGTARAEIKNKQFDDLLELVKNTLDVPIPLTALNQRVATLIPTGIVGLFGTLTSLIGVYQAWIKVK